jgi:hypothetical protein
MSSLAFLVARQQKESLIQQELGKRETRQGQP